MKKILAIAAIAAAMSGCSSYTQISRFTTAAKTDNGATPIGAVAVFNVSYSVFGVLPICSGDTWKIGPYGSHPGRNTIWFENRCTIDENLASLNHALDEIGSHKVENLVTDSSSWSTWSLFIVKRTVLKSTCTVLK